LNEQLIGKPMLRHLWKIAEASNHYFSLRAELQANARPCASGDKECAFISRADPMTR
jgi:hypothetical protein